MGKNQFVVRRGKEWAVIGANNTKATRVVSTQKEAIGIARSIAQNKHAYRTEMVIFASATVTAMIRVRQSTKTYNTILCAVAYIATAFSKY